MAAVQGAIMDQEVTLGTEAHKTEEQDKVSGLLIPGRFCGGPR